MTNAIGMAVMEVVLNPGVSDAEVERFWLEEFLPKATVLFDWTPSLLKGDHGERPGEYLFVVQFASHKRARELFPFKEGQPDPMGSLEFQQWTAANPVYEKFLSHFDFAKSWARFTYYVGVS